MTFIGVSSEATFPNKAEEEFYDPSNSFRIQKELLFLSSRAQFSLWRRDRDTRIKHCAVTDYLQFEVKTFAKGQLIYFPNSHEVWEGNIDPNDKNGKLKMTALLELKLKLKTHQTFQTHYPFFPLNFQSKLFFSYTSSNFYIFSQRTEVSYLNRCFFLIHGYNTQINANSISQNTRPAPG